jgi:predicted RNase H-like nuclease (RuvC/YqgF family)
MGAMYVIAGIVGLVWIAFASYMAHRHRDNKSKRLMWLALAGVGLIPVVLSILRPGDKDKTTVVEVKPHEREVAPTPDEQAELDADANKVEEEAGELEEASEKLDEEAENLDAEHEQLEEKAEETDRALEEIENPDDDDAGDGGSRQPDPDISDRLRRG